MLVNSGEELGGASTRWPTADRPVSSPVYFKRQVQDVVSASLNFGARIQMPKPKGQAAKAGLKFEAAVLATLDKKFAGRFCSGVPLSFQEGLSKNGFYQRPSTAIPDGLFLSASRDILCIIEIKLRHSTDAWFQLNRFYLPIMRRIVGNSILLRTLEICKYYDPGVRLPEEKTLVLKPEDSFSVKQGKHPVLIWER